jgi:hypothetical protein
MLFLDRAAEVGGVRMTSAGYMVASCRVAKANVVQHCTRDELGLPPTAPEMVGVWRDPAEIFHADSMRSWAFRPFCIDHPPHGVDSTSWRQYAAGFVDGEIARDGDFLRLNIMVADADAQCAIRDGRRELSAGYSVDLDWSSPGVTPSGEQYHAIARRVRGDHVAAVVKGRAGPECAIVLGDRAAAATSTPALPSSGVRTVTETIVVDGKSVQIDSAAAEIIRCLQGQVAALRHVADQQQPQRIDFRDQRFADVLRRGAAEAFNERARAMHDESTPYGRYVKGLRDGWKHRAA